MSTEDQTEKKETLTKTVVVMDYLDKPSPYSSNIYSTAVVEKAINEYNAKEEMFGQIGFPDHGENYIDMQKVSHKVSNMRIEDGKWIATVTVLNTPYGEMLKELLLGDVVRFGSRGFGVIDEATNMITSYDLISVDALPQDNYGEGNEN